MRVYISGISGTGMGPLALMAKKAGHIISGSDLAKGAVYDELVKAGIDVKIGPQDGKFLRQKLEDGIDWFVYTSALPEDHPELALARKAGVICTKRDDFTAHLVDALKLKMVAVAGTHGKTTTTAMIIYTARKMKLPVSYVVGTTLGFASSGSYRKGDVYFVYEADEYDKNFLKFHPWLSIITAESYDHPDIYPTKQSYHAAFKKFKEQSRRVIEKGIYEKEMTLAGEMRRRDASLAAAALVAMAPRISRESVKFLLNKFPGVGRRFERIENGVYTDYAHHPEEIAATIDVARDEVTRRHKKGIVVVYQPHQNTRQHEVLEGYKDAFVGVDKLFWLPTYLTREDPKLKVLTPADFIKTLSNKEIAEPAEMGAKLKRQLERYAAEGYLILLMSAGPADEWFRKAMVKE